MTVRRLNFSPILIGLRIGIAIMWLCAAVESSHSAATILPNGENCFSATTPTSGGLYGPLVTLGAITGGSGYVSAVYTNVPLTGGSGFGAKATISVTAGVVAGVSVTNAGSHYTSGDTLSAAAANLGGSGSGFSIPVNIVSTTGTGLLGLLGPITGGTGGTSGTYAGVSLTGGSGSGATANITVSGGAVTQVTILDPGSQYQVGDTLSAASGNIGGTSGFSVQVSSISINNSLAGGSVYFYIPNTVTFKQTWQNASQTTLNTNPVTLDANGCATIYGTGIYRQVLQDSIGNTVWDKITTDTSAQQNVFWAGLAGGTPNAVTLVDPGFNATDGSIINFLALSDNTGATTINPSSFGAIPVVKDTSQGPEALSGGEFVATNPISVIYSATENSFHILNPIIVNNTNQCTLITAFGGAGNNSTDNTTPLENAVASLTGNGGCIYFQPGKYLFQSSPTLSLPGGIFSLSIRGSGQDNTILTWPNINGGLTINYGGAETSAHVSDLTFTTSVTNGGNALTLNLTTPNSNPANTAVSDITRVSIRGDDGYGVTEYWTNGINIQNISNVNVNGVSITGTIATPSGNGLNLIGLPASSTFAVQFNVRQSNFSYLNQGIVYGSFVQGVTVSQSNFVADNFGIAAPVGTIGGLTQLAVSDSQFGSNSSAAIVTQVPVADTQITNSLFIMDKANENGIALNQNNHFTITGNQIQSSTTSGTGGIIIGTNSMGATGTITGNDIFGFATGITLLSGSQNTLVSGNTISNNTTPFADAGSGNTVGQTCTSITAGTTVITQGITTHC